MQNQWHLIYSHSNMQGQSFCVNVLLYDVRCFARCGNVYFATLLKVSSIGVFHVFVVVQIVPNRAKRCISGKCISLTL